MPATRAVFRAHVLEPALDEGLPLGVLVLDVDVAAAVEVLAPDIHRQILRPVILDARPDDFGPRLETGDAVGAGAERRFERRLGHVARLAAGVGPFPPVPRQHRHVAEDQRKLAIPGLVEGEQHLMLADRLCLGHVREVAIEEGADLLQHAEGPDDVLRRDGLSVVPARGWIQAVSGRGIVVRIPEGFGDERMAGARLVDRLVHQRVPQNTAGLSEAGGWGAANDEGIEGIEGAGGDAVQRPALGRVRIDVVVALEAPGIYRLADQGGRRAPSAIRSLCMGGGRQASREEGKEGGGERFRLQHSGSHVGRLPSSRARFSGADVKPVRTARPEGNKKSRAEPGFFVVMRLRFRQVTAPPAPHPGPAPR
jgi:hypothetical protein